MEVAGLVLGAVSVLIWATEKGLQMREDYKDTPKVVKAVNCRLQTIDIRLRKAYERVGFVADDPSSSFRRSLETMYRNGCLTRVTDIELLLSMERDLFRAVQKLMKLFDVDMDMKKGHPTRDTTKKRLLKLKYSWCRGRYEQMVNRVNKQADTMCQILDTASLSLSAHGARSGKVAGRYQPEQCLSVRQRLNLVYRIMKTGLCCGSPHPHKAALYFDQLTYTPSDPPPYGVTFSCGRQGKDVWRTICLTPQPKPQQVLAVPYPATLPAWPRTPPAASLQRCTPISAEQSASVSDYIRLVPLRPSFNSRADPITPPPDVPSICDMVTRGVAEGLVRDGDIGFACKLGADAPAEIIDLWAARQRVRNPYRELKHRYGMAAHLVWSVLHLSGGPWLDDQWDESRARVGVVVFGEGGSGCEISKYPYFDVEFPNASSGLRGNAGPVHSMPPTPEADDMLTRLIPSKTVLAVGVLLTEIFLVDRQPGLPLGSIVQRYNSVIQNHGDLISYAGASYADAVMRCIRCAFSLSSQSVDFDERDVQQGFYTGVVAPIVAAYETVSTI